MSEHHHEGHQLVGDHRHPRPYVTLTGVTGTLSTSKIFEGIVIVWRLLMKNSISNNQIFCFVLILERRKWKNKFLELELNP